MAAPIRVLHFSTHNEDCGIAKYQEQFVAGMSHLSDDIYNEYFDLSPNQTKVMPKAQLDAAMDRLAKQVQEFDLLHVQHETSFFKQDELEQIMRKVHAAGKPVMVTVHAAPEVQYQRAHRGGMGPRSLVHYAKAKRAEKAFITRYVAPLRDADSIIVHNQATCDNLVAHGVAAEKITVIRHPVQDVSFDLKTDEIKRNLRTSDQDVIFCTVGFLSEAKGVLEAVKALPFLPANYKLAILAGVHPDGVNDEAFLNHICDVIQQLDLKDRVYITGFVEDDDRLNALIRECDAAVYPYNRQYYAYVSSGAVNLALANHKPTIAYPTMALLEINSDMEAVRFCASANYYELARELKTLDFAKAAERATEYANRYSWGKEAVAFAQIYRDFLGK